MLNNDGDLQPLPVERAADLPNVNLVTIRQDVAAETEPSSLQLENSHLLSGHRGTVSEGMQPVTNAAVTLSYRQLKSPLLCRRSICFAKTAAALLHSSDVLPCGNLAVS